MIKNILTYYASLLDEYLRPDFPQPEGVAEVGFVGSSHQGSSNKLLISLFGIERETAGGISPTRQSVQGETMQGNLLMKRMPCSASVHPPIHPMTGMPTRKWPTCYSG